MLFFYKYEIRTYIHVGLVQNGSVISKIFILKNGRTVSILHSIDISTHQKKK